MNGIIWLWKHRHCWEQLRYLYSHRYELKRILARVQIHPDSPEGVDNILARLRDFDRIPLARPIPPREKLTPQQELYEIWLPTNTNNPKPFLEKDSN